MNRNAIVLAAASRFPAGVILAMAAETLEDLQERHGEILARAEEIDETEDPTEEQNAELSALLAEAERVKARIDNKLAIQNLRAAAPGRRSTPEPQNRNERGGNQRITSPEARKYPVGQAGFQNFGEFAMTVRAAGGDAPDPGAVQRLRNALTTYGNEGTGADGGYAVPPDFRRDIAIKITGEDSLLSRTDRMITSTNSMVLPKDETTPWGSSGIQAYWENEAGQKTQSKPVLGQNTLRLNKLIALVPVTDELLEDAPSIDSYLRRKTPEVMTAKLNTALVSGTGAGQPLGFMNSPSLVTITKETSQPADTIYFANIVKMYSRMRASSLPRSVWLINQSILPQLLSMSFDPAATAGKVPVYLPGGMVADAPFGTLLGRPILPLEAMAALGDLGDIALVDLSQYLTVTKAQDIKTDVSMHLFFDYDVTAFRFVFRVAGQPWWAAPVTPQASGAATLSSFVTLEAR